MEGAGAPEAAWRQLDRLERSFPPLLLAVVAAAALFEAEAEQHRQHRPPRKQTARLERSFPPLLLAVAAAALFEAEAEWQPLLQRRASLPHRLHVLRQTPTQHNLHRLIPPPILRRIPRRTHRLRTPAVLRRPLLMPPCDQAPLPDRAPREAGVEGEQRLHHWPRLLLLLLLLGRLSNRQALGAGAAAGPRPLRRLHRQLREAPLRCPLSAHPPSRGYRQRQAARRVEAEDKPRLKRRPHIRRLQRRVREAREVEDALHRPLQHHQKLQQLVVHSQNLGLRLHSLLPWLRNPSPSQLGSFFKRAISTRQTSKSSHRWSKASFTRSSVQHPRPLPPRRPHQLCRR